MPDSSQTIRTSHLLTVGYCLAIALAVSMCHFDGNENKFTGVVHPTAGEFAGSETCAQCHPSITESHTHTPHFLTSRLASPKTVLGSFDSGMNVVVLNATLKLVMDKTDSQMFQTAFAAGKVIGREPFDISIGSGRQGQTYLYWQDNSLFQLPVSYHTGLRSWTNSPGYPPDQVIFDRNIPARCMECHSTYMKIAKSVGARETFDRSKVVLGVDCERCHGPAAGHVSFHLSHRGEKQARRIINPGRLTRQQRLDNCALCHSGVRDNFMPSFTFTVGDRLDDFSSPVDGGDSAATLDVHGNQYGLLASSKCFRNSEMDCSSCHNVHVKETKKLDLFSRRCMNCHKPGSDHYCKRPESPGLVLSNNCIDCHMPRLPSRQVLLRTADNVQPTPFYVRTHLVGIYKELPQKH